jgi:hypothetical protein
MAWEGVGGRGRAWEGVGGRGRAWEGVGGRGMGEPWTQTVTVRAWAISVAVTPAGKGTSTCVVCTMLTWTLSEPVLAPAAACVTVEARTAGSRVAAALGSMSRVEVVA